MIKRLTQLRTVVFILFVVAFVPVKAQSLSAFIDATGGNLSVCQNGNYSLTASAFDGSGVYVSHEWVSADDIIWKSVDNVALISTKKTGVFTVIYRVYDDAGAMAEASITFEVKPSPMARLIKSSQGVEVKLEKANNATVVWYKNGQEISGSGVYLKDLVAGSYYAVVSGSNGCSMRTNKVDFE